jgi:hypothetical protein
MIKHLLLLSIFISINILVYLFPATSYADLYLYRDKYGKLHMRDKPENNNSYTLLKKTSAYQQNSNKKEIHPSKPIQKYTYEPKKTSHKQNSNKKEMRPPKLIQKYTYEPKKTYISKRVALVVGNSAYQNTYELTNPENDALAIGKN